LVVIRDYFFISLGLLRDPFGEIPAKEIKSSPRCTMALDFKFYREPQAGGLDSLLNYSVFPKGLLRDPFGGIPAKEIKSRPRCTMALDFKFYREPQAGGLGSL
jgi:hypothetical protein